MLIYCRGIAVIEHGETGVHYEVFPEELEWESIGSSERSMGPETVYGATVDHIALGELLWSVVEYPEGAENTKETSVGKHNLVEDFDFGLEHEPDGPEPDNLASWLKDNADYATKLTQSSLVSLLVEWFHYYYEDPANETPYNSREGGYQYIHGGPYDAENELRENFEGIVIEEVILKTVQQVQDDGIYDWAPSSMHPDREADALDAMAENLGDREYSFEALRAISASASAPRLGSRAELEKRLEVLEKIAALQYSLPMLGEHGGIGHNQPPSDLEIDPAGIPEIQEELEALKSEFTANAPNVEAVAEKASRLSKFIGWVGGKLDKTIDEFCKAFGSTLGKSSGLAVPVLLIPTYWGKLAELLIGLKDWLLFALNIG